MILINESSPILYIQKPSEQHITVRKISSFLRLVPGWNYGEGDTFNEDIIDRAIELHKLLLSFVFYETDAFPGTDGSIMVTAYDNDDCLEFTIETDGGIRCILESNDVAVYEQENLTILQVKDILKQLRRERWRPSDSSILSTMTVVANVFVPQLLHLSGREFLLSTSNASLHLEELSANILKPITLPLPVNRQFFGSSQPIYFPSQVPWFIQ
jgi:hypothetical protein